MLSRLKRLLALFALMLIPTGVAAASVAKEPGDAASEVATLLSAWDRADAPGVAVVVRLDGQVVADLNVGLADLEHDVPIRSTSVFHAASLSKQVTAFAILLLEQDGRLSIDDPLTTYIPEAAHLGPITLRQLMNHTSGLRDQWTLLGMAGWRAEDLVTDDQVLRLVLDQTAGNFQPGTAYQYTNSGYSLLAEVVHRVSGQKLSAFARTRIFEPIGMSQTRFQDEISEVIADRALSYRPGEQGYVREILNYATAGPTGLKTTARDLSRWAANFETGAVGGPPVLRRMEEQGVLADGTIDIYALGQERRPYKGLDTWSHGGRDAGFRSFLLRVPSERFSVSVLSNAADFDSAEVAFAIADIYLAQRPAFQPAPTQTPDAPTAEQLASYVGHYEVFPGVIFTISTGEDQLLFSVVGGDEPTAPLVLSPTSFELNSRPELVLEFPEAVDGAVSSIGYRIGLHGTLVAPRIDLVPFTPESTNLNAFVGRYYSPELKTEYALVVVDGTLMARHARRPDIALHAYQPDTFSSAEWFFQRVVFDRDPSGSIVGFQASGAVAEDIRFVRQDAP